MIDLRLGDCLKVMPSIPDKSIDMIMADLPYGTTACKWDTIIDFELLWEQYKRIIKDNGAIVLTASQPFTSALVMSNPDMFKYEWIWEKSKANGFLDVNKKPMRSHENVLVFYKKQPNYTPIKTPGKPYNKGIITYQAPHYGNQGTRDGENKDGLRFPRSVLYFKTAESEGKSEHPTQKPVALMSYLIKTYTNEGDNVLDNVMGSGTTGVACKLLKRNFIGIELLEEYYNIARKRIDSTQEMML